MKRTSKYLGKTFGSWTCSYVGIANVQGKRVKGAGKRNYYYIFERITSDGKAEKMIRLNSTEAASVYKGKLSVEDVLNKRESRRSRKFNKKIFYHFI